MNIYDFISMPMPERETKMHLGYISAEQAESIRGRSLRFRDLQSMVGECVLVERKRQGATDWAVYLVEKFLRDNQEVWSKEDSAKADRCVMKDSYKNLENVRLYFSELYCTGGRFDGETAYQSSIYEIKKERA